MVNTEALVVLAYSAGVPVGDAEK